MREKLVRVRTQILAILVLALFACSDDDRPPEWSYIHEAIIKPSCTTSACHAKISSAAGIELFDADNAYVLLTGRVCNGAEPPGEPPRNFVVPGDPDRSKLMYLLRGEEVRNMPPDVPLPVADIDLIEQWIVEGAECN
jgi:hypothetical protein